MGRSLCAPRSHTRRVALTATLLCLFIVLSARYHSSAHEAVDGFVTEHLTDLPFGFTRPSKHEDDTHGSPDAIQSPKLQEEAASGHQTQTQKTAGSLAQPSLPGCPIIPSSSDFLVSMKTGSTELFAKLPQQLLTTLRCVPNYMVFSDIEQDIGGTHVYGSLEEISDKYKYSHRDFEFYRRLLDLSAKNQDLSLLKITSQASGAAWDLDKWKFVPIAHRVYVEQPHVKWYIFLEADAYMAWSNVLELLAYYDSEQPWYLGATHFYGDVAFAHGGMGYILSNGAMKLLDGIWTPKNVARWEKSTSNACCGDVELAAVLTEAGVNITGIPGLYGESPTWFEWAEHKWCEPALSWHHVRPHEVEALWNFEAQLYTQGSTHYMYRDLFHDLIEQHLIPTREDWDNLSRDRIYTGSSGVHGDEDRMYDLTVVLEQLELSDEEKEHLLEELNEDQKESVESTGKYIRETKWDELEEKERETAWEALTEAEKEAHTSLKNCRAACEDWDECIQFFHMPDRCHLHRTIRLGNYVQPDVVESFADLEDLVQANRSTSGWIKHRIEELKDRVEDCKPVPEWMSEYVENDSRKG